MVLKAHTDDINTVDWCKLDTNYVATGSNDQRVCIIDIRRLSSDADQSLDIAETPSAV
jgi:WD40 repeat protein